MFYLLVLVSMKAILSKDKHVTTNTGINKFCIFLQYCTLHFSICFNKIVLFILDYVDAWLPFRLNRYIFNGLISYEEGNIIATLLRRIIYRNLKINILLRSKLNPLGMTYFFKDVASLYVQKGYLVNVLLYYFLLN